MDEHQETSRIIAMRNTMIVVYTIIAVAILIVTSVFMIVSKNRSMLSQSEIYCSVAVHQTGRSVENFCENVEMASSIIYEEKELVEFYPKYDDYTAEELAIKDRITELFSKANYITDYCDFGIIYSNNSVAGIVSDGTLDLLGDNVFQKTSDLIRRNDRSWNVFYSDNVSRICFLKRVNDNAVFIASVYSSQFGHVFGKLSSSSSLSLYLADSEDKIIFSSANTSAIYGEPLPVEVTSRMGGEVNKTVGDDKGVCCALELANGWAIYCIVTPNVDGKFRSSPTETFLAVILLSTLILFIMTGFFIASFFASKKRIPRIREEKLDPVTGVLTPYYCEERISDLIEISLIGGTWAFAIVRINELDLISERVGESFADQSLQKVAEILKNTFGTETAIGLNGSKEFIVFSDFSDFDLFMSHNNLRSKFTALRTKLDNVLVGENEDYKLDISIAVCIYPDHGKTFEDLEFKAKSLIYDSPSDEAARLVFYDEKKSGGGKA
ncbi:MAG: diguanylate cyclase [Ruminococcus sp.]|nr:diguanylate cyclase [Ruminococcus sp.]MBR6874649.1 diguanylate cyclase [Ruminococcus sp.]